MTAELTSNTKKQSAAGDSRSWWTLGLLLLGQFMGLLDVYIVNVAMPSIGADLHASGASLQLVVGGYTVAYAMLLITGARLGDLFGRRRMFLVGVVGFTLASLICGLAPNIAVLIVFRFIQGGTAALMIPQIISVIQMRFSGRARATALSLYSVTLSVGAVAGLVLGGVLVNANLFNAHWRPTFLVNVPLGIILVALAPVLLPADRPTGTRRIDPLGLAIAVPAVFLVVLPLVLGHDVGWPAWTFVCMAIGVALGVVFVAVERRVSARGGDPLLDLKVLHSGGLPAGLTTLLSVAAPYGGLLFVFTLHLQSGLGDSALHAGLVFIPMAVGNGLLGFYWRKLPERIHHLLPAIGALLIAVGGLALVATMNGGSGDNALTWVALFVFGAGMGLAISPVLSQSLVHVPLKQAGDASGLLTTAMQLGQVVGVAALGTVYLSVLRPLPPHTPQLAQSSAHALSITAYSAAALIIVGALSALALARATLRAKALKAA
ncbi:MAG TPA: MFS transporter [Pseudonocardiaceae bacterium]